ncbi:hypothetical protein GGX14DRAFT_694913 [Mycena pura]|uniref:Uncharacterized protein n=1 Tax=Mycena pura TaxID=153505 RepID=A0AAD6YKJ3_9AGAR|nr:hypothetical protein GGX14DRAFT_694913 [Mycena pura]
MATTQSPNGTDTDVHPSAVGTNTVPDTTQDEERDSVSDAPLENSQYPEQKHAGAVGYGPNWHSKPGFLDKVTGIKEQVSGKVTRNPELAQRGHDRRTGELHQNELEADAKEDPFANPEEKGAVPPSQADAKSPTTTSDAPSKAFASDSQKTSNA